ncbi:hypothetical protein OUZ56_029171 [Daphnia magna]|uniref:Uncharacterized protein n=1 Tax=Daphnia magna TaxID=35525 RepID=A0ABR0B621_9CRUS|nr:hypothetical protein OUZ56_029163 [Daphnia magna]KAK4037131.1 hypothetical protein OUZ56_029171 [Daphnia magna]
MGYLLNKKVYFPTWMENAANTLNANLKLWLSNTTSNFGPVQGREICGASSARQPILLAKTTAVGARRPTLCCCPSIHLLALPVTSLTASVRQHPFCPSTHSLSAKTPAVVARQPYRCLARPPPHSLCPSTQSLYLQVDSITVSARRPNHCRPKFPLYLPVESLSLCPSSHSLPTKVPNEVARQLIYCLWLSNP